MKNCRIGSIGLILCGLLLACSPDRKSGDSASRVSIQMPKDFGIASLSGTACFAVNIVAADIQTAAQNSCDPAYGVFAGLVPAGDIVELETSYGTARTIEIYYVISDVGCTPFTADQGLGQTFGSNKVYRISQTTGVDFQSSEVVVEAQIEWPSNSNRLNNLMGSPTSCNKGETPIQLMSVRQGRALQGAANGSTQNGSQMKVRVLDYQVPILKSNSFNHKIQPIRLGDTQ